MLKKVEYNQHDYELRHIPPTFSFSFFPLEGF